MRVGIIQLLESPNRTKRQGKSKFTLSAWAERSIFSCPGPQSSVSASGSPAFQLRSWLTPSAPPHSTPVPRPLDSDWITALAFLAFQLVDGRSWDFSSNMTVWANSYNKSLIYIYIYICIYSYILLLLFLWRTLTNTLLFILSVFWAEQKLDSLIPHSISPNCSFTSLSLFVAF